MVESGEASKMRSMECHSSVDEELWAERRAKLSKLRPVTDNHAFHLRISTEQKFEAEAEPHSPSAAVVQDVSGNHQSFE